MEKIIIIAKLQVIFFPDPVAWMCLRGLQVCGGVTNTVSLFSSPFRVPKDAQEWGKVKEGIRKDFPCFLQSLWVSVQNILTALLPQCNK